jgi:hypothetical protein
MVPAGQRLGSEKRVAFPGELRLVQNLDLAVPDRGGQFLIPLAVAAPVGTAATIRGVFGDEHGGRLAEAAPRVSLRAARVANRDAGP